MTYGGPAVAAIHVCGVALVVGGGVTGGGGDDAGSDGKDEGECTDEHDDDQWMLVGRHLQRKRKRRTTEDAAILMGGIGRRADAILYARRVGGTIQYRTSPSRAASWIPFLFFFRVRGGRRKV